MHDIHVDGGTLYQWDTGRRLYIDPRPGETVDEVHYSYSKSPDALNVYPEIVDGVITADIPNVILQTSGAFIAYVVMTTEDGSRTTHSCGFSVMARPKPDDYVHVEEDVLRYETLVKRLDDIEANGVPDEQVKAQVDQYFVENPVGSGMNLMDGEADGSLRSIYSTEESEEYKLGKYAVAVGHNTKASGEASFAEGRSTEASGAGAHVEGISSKASGIRSHAENGGTQANGEDSHSEGLLTKADGRAAHAEGCNTVATGEYQHVQGKYNVPDPDGRYAHIVGNGGGKFIPELIDYERSNAHTLDWDGNAWFAGKVYVGGTSMDDATELGASGGSGVDEEAVREIVEEALTEAKESGDFKGEPGKDGYTPVKGVDYFDGERGEKGDPGYTPVKGVDYFDGKDGADGAPGEPGYTPQKGVDYFDGAPGEPGKDGADGKPGADGFSPTVTLTREADGVVITATNKDGETSEKVYDGKDGAGGEGGGLPEGGEPHQMLVTDGEGNAKWQERTHYIEEVEAELYPETTVTGEEGEFVVAEPYAFYPTVGGTYTVTFVSGGTTIPFNCVATEFDLEGIPTVALGNVGALTGGGDTGEPFVLFFIQEDVASGAGMYALIMFLSGADTEITFSVSGMVESVHMIDEKYIPKFGASSLANGTGVGSVRNFFGYAEDETYQMGNYAFSWRGRATGETSLAWSGTASGDSSVSFGEEASGVGSFAANGSYATGFQSFAANNGKASGDHSFAEGFSAEAKGARSHAEGYMTIAASGSQHVQGKFNIEDTEDKYAHIVGNGANKNARSNAHTLDWDGNGWYAGSLYVGGTSRDDASKVLTEAKAGTVINTALAEAKASGEFKGDPGEKGDQGEQGIPGEKGDPGATGPTGPAGYTPVKGTDYYTAADKNEMVSLVLAALPTWGGGSY